MYGKGNSASRRANGTSGPKWFEVLETRQLLSVSVGSAPGADAPAAIVVKATEPVVTTGSVTGQVTDSSGSPLAGASVIIVSSTAGTASNISEITTNSAGSYTFPTVPVGSYIVRSYDIGYVPNSTAAFTVAQGANTAPTLKLAQAASVTGNVTDSKSASLQGATVTLSPAVENSGLPSYTTTSNDSGAYTFPSVTPGSYILRAYKSGYTSYQSAALTIALGANPEPTIQLTQIIYGSVTGQVTDANGNPISGASVVILTSSGGSVSGLSSVKTNSTGNYSYTSVPVGNYEVRAYATGYFSNTTASFAVAQGTNTAPTLKLTQGATVTGNVTDSTSAALAGVSLSLTPAVENSGLTSYSTTSNDTGAYTFPTVAPGSYVLRAYKSGYSSYQSSAITIVVGANSEPTIQLTKIVYGSLTGLVTDGNGNPISGASVLVLTSTGTQVPGTSEVKTNSSGDYSFSSLPVGSYEIRAYAEGYFSNTTAVFTITQGANTAPTLKLTQGATVTGSVTDTSSNPISGASVSLTPAVEGSGLTSYSATTNSSGVYTFGTITPGSYILHVLDSGYVSYASAALTITAGSNTLPAVQLMAIQYGSVTGLVTDANGNPIAGATVGIAESSNTAGGSVASVQTNSSGVYTFAKVPVGTAEVRASATGYLPAYTSAITITQGATTTAPTLKLTAAGTVTGAVTNSTGGPIANANVLITPATAGGEGIVAFDAGATTNSAGQYTFPAVPAGSYIVRVTAAGYFTDSSASFTVTVGQNTAPTVAPTSAPTVTPVGPGSSTSPGPLLNTLTPTLTWTINGPTTNVTGLLLNIYDVTAGKLVSYTIDPSQTSYTVASGVLTSGHTYIWNIRVLNGSAQGPEGGYLFFHV